MNVWTITNKTFKRLWKKRSWLNFKAQSRNLPAGTKENHGEPIRAVSAMAETVTGHLQNTNQKIHRLRRFAQFKLSRLAYIQDASDHQLSWSSQLWFFSVYRSVLETSIVCFLETYRAISLVLQTALLNALPANRLNKIKQQNCVFGTCSVRISAGIHAILTEKSHSFSQSLHAPGLYLDYATTASFPSFPIHLLSYH